MSKALWIFTIVVCANIIIFGTLYIIDKERYLGWLINFSQPVIQFIHFNDIYDIMRSPPWVEKLLKVKESKAITVFSGDILSPSILAESMKGHQFLHLLKLVEIDFAVPGNHEADLGVGAFMDFKAQHPHTKWLLANIKKKGTVRSDNAAVGYGEIQAYAIHEQQGLKFCFIGLADKEWMANIKGAEVGTYEYEDYLTTTRTLSKSLRAKGCHIISVISHMKNDHDRMLLHDEESDINIIFGGHDHVYYIYRYHNKLLIKSGSDFDQFSNIHLQFVKERPKDETRCRFIKPIPQSDIIGQPNDSDGGDKTKGEKVEPGKSPEQKPDGSANAAGTATTPNGASQTAQATDPTKTTQLPDASKTPESTSSSNPDKQADDEAEDEDDTAAERKSESNEGKVKQYDYTYDEITSNKDFNKWVFLLETPNSPANFLQVKLELNLVDMMKDPENADMHDYIIQRIYPVVSEYMSSMFEISEQMDAREISISRRESEIGDLIADILRIDYKVDVAIINAGSIKSETFFQQNYKFVEKDIKKMFSRDSKMEVIEVLGSDLIKVFELFFQYLPAANGNFIVFSGIRMKVNEKAPKGSKIIHNSVMVGDDRLDLDFKYTLAILDFLLGVVLKQYPDINKRKFAFPVEEQKRPIDSLKTFLQLPTDPDNFREFQLFHQTFPDITIDELSMRERKSIEKDVVKFLKEEVGETPTKAELDRATNSLMKRLKFYTLANDISEKHDQPIFVIKPRKDDRLIIVEDESKDEKDKPAQDNKSPKPDRNLLLFV